jgi:methyl-accepting chemotaxis protein
MTLKLRMLLAIIPLVVGSILLMGIMSVNFAVNNSTESLTEAVEARLLSQDVQTKEAFDKYFGFVESQIRAKSYELSMVDATLAFLPAYREYASQRGDISSSQMNELESYYSNDFTQQYNQLNPTGLNNAKQLLNSIDGTGLALQYDFIAGSSYPLGGKGGLDQPANNTPYAKAHQKYHPALRSFLQEFGYYDIFIADIDTGNIVYSVFKELDYATSISTGPYADSGIGDVFKLASRATSEDQVFFSKFKRYRPSYDALAGFAATPIYSNGKAIAVLIFQMPLETINSILTHNSKWSEKGFGESGETYLVNSNGLLLNESRFFVEDKNGYFAAVRNKYPIQTKEIQARNTTVGIQPIESNSVTQALKGNSGFNLIKDYRDVEVFSVYSPVKVGEHTFALIAEVDVEEALRPAQTLKTTLVSATIVITLILVGIAIVVALFFANRLVKPLNELGERCHALTVGEGDLTLKLEPSNIPEINKISSNFNVFIEQIRVIVEQMKIDAETLSSASHELSAITTQSETVATQQRDQTAMVATAMEQLAASIGEVSRSTNDTSNKSIEAQNSLVENMERADMAASNIKLLVTLINDSSVVISSLKSEVHKITGVLSVITSIADQTNLLALNAAIEAARAGEAGRGFSVVADEVRALATRSQESTVEISKLVDVMIQSSEKSVERMERAAAAADGGIHLVDLVTTAMDELAANLKSVLLLTDTVASATEEQDATSRSVAVNVTNINDMAADVNRGAAQSSTAATELASIAAHSQEQLSRFKV